jgi:hypothetical protein
MVELEVLKAPGPPNGPIGVVEEGCVKYAGGFHGGVEQGCVELAEFGTDADPLWLSAGCALDDRSADILLMDGGNRWRPDVRSCEKKMDGV